MYLNLILKNEKEFVKNKLSIFEKYYCDMIISIYQYEVL